LVGLPVVVGIVDCIVDMHNHYRGFHYVFHYVEPFRSSLECVTSFKRFMLVITIVILESPCR
jgi:hypothetical protein